ncbi:MAG: pyridoxal phosphate-dependent aminotransferase [Ardenticatenaceae bacterium]|nr:pyridoxal phosphate-dependent aminotransferase [Ardenticatenaceae bacterium]MCB8989916.1 pyridoxal phosphate-dependent aminotransferase [Ardenticatenaceae bacterium]
MQIAPFDVELFFAVYEFATPHVLCASDCESMTVTDLLELAGMTMADLGTQWLGYTESQGHPDLRGLVAAQIGGAVTAQDVVVLATPEEGIYLTMRTLLEPGDHVVVLTPAYNSLLNVAEHVSGNVSRWEIEATAVSFQLDLNKLANLLTDETKLLIVNFPHNPTGLLPTPEEFAQIVALAQQHDVWLFCDEMYRGLELDGRSPLPSAITQYEKSIVLSGLSKTQGLPGLRSGWLLVRDESLRAALINWKHYTSICPPTPSEFLAMAALRAHDKLVARNVAIITQNLQAADAFFARWPQLFTWRRPSAGSVALVETAVPSTTTYCIQLAEEAGVLFLPGPYIGYHDTFMRWGFGRKNFADNLAHYEAYLQKKIGD